MRTKVVKCLPSDWHLYPSLFGLRRICILLAFATMVNIFQNPCVPSLVSTEKVVNSTIQNEKAYIN